VEKLAVLKTVSGADVHKTFAPSRLIQADMGLPDGPQRCAAWQTKPPKSRRVLPDCRPESSSGSSDRMSIWAAG
jgi:hypothetical protein